MPAINLVVIVFSYAHEIGNQCCVKSMVQPDSGLSKYVMSVQKKSTLIS